MYERELNEFQVICFVFFEHSEWLYDRANEQKLKYKYLLKKNKLIQRLCTYTQIIFISMVWYRAQLL